jgi:hypothetical protein
MSKKSKKQEEPQKKEKLTTSDAIINRLKWDQSLPSEDFVIGYLDRFLGIMESTMDTHGKFAIFCYLFSRLVGIHILVY